MASDEDTKLSLEENFEWNVEAEIRLFEAMIGHKPVGINKHFHMACISEKFENLIGRPVPSEVIWKHLETMFDLAALDKKESIPFPNEQEEFSLPESEYLDLINEKMACKTEPFSEIKEIAKENKATPKVNKELSSIKDTVGKRERKLEVEDSVSNYESEKNEIVEVENDGKKSKLSKDEKTVKTRAKRNTKEKKGDEDISQSPASVIKKEEDSSSTTSSAKKEKQAVGKRALRSRTDDSSSNKSMTPPPVKRARRI